MRLADGSSNGRAAGGAGGKSRAGGWLRRLLLPHCGKPQVLPHGSFGSKGGGSGGSVAISSCSGSSGDGPALARARPPAALVVYRFRYGVRRLTVTDRVRVHGGLVCSVRRELKLS